MLSPLGDEVKIMYGFATLVTLPPLVGYGIVRTWAMVSGSTDHRSQRNSSGSWTSMSYGVQASRGK